MAKRGRPTKHKKAIKRFEPPATLPAGYDAICGYCGCPFTFDNSLVCHTLDYKSYCTQGCEDEASSRDDIGEPDR